MIDQKAWQKDIENKLKELNATEERLLGIIGAAKKVIEEKEKMLEQVKKNKENLEVALEGIKEYSVIKIENDKKETKEEKKASGKELVTITRNPKIGRFDAHGNQTGLWLSQCSAARNLGITQSGLSYIMRQPIEKQIEKRNCYFKWVH